MESRQFSRQSAVLLLALITAMGIILRVAGLGQDLWIDEVATLDALRESTPWQLLTTYGGANHHMLNSLLVWVSIKLMGETEWTVRLAAVFFGAATVPVMYWMGRLARFTRGEALAGALLLALSYHHIWFSQNARGYTGYIFFSLLATGALVRVLNAPGRRWVVLFVAASGLNFLALLPSVCVFGAQVIAAGAALWFDRSPVPGDAGRRRRVLVALAAGAAMALMVYAPIGLEILKSLGRFAPKQVTAFPLASLAFVQEVVRGLFPGVSAAWLVLVPLPVAFVIAGTVAIVRQAPVLAGVLIGSHLLFAGVILVLGWPIYPRLFILALPLGLLTLVALAAALERRLPDRWPVLRRSFAPAVLVAATAGLALLLPGLYRLPKQPYRLALTEAARLGGPEPLAIAVGTADRGIKYYMEREPSRPIQVGYARTVGEFNKFLAGHPRKNILLISTFNRALAIERPELWALMQKGWRRAVVCPGNLQGGEITVWAPLAEPAAAP